MSEMNQLTDCVLEVSHNLATGNRGTVTAKNYTWNSKGDLKFWQITLIESLLNGMAAMAALERHIRVSKSVKSNSIKRLEESYCLLKEYFCGVGTCTIQQSDSNFS